MNKIEEVVENIIKELNGRKGFDFYDFDGDILDEIKEELVKLILPIVSNQRELLNWMKKNNHLAKTEEQINELLLDYNFETIL